MLRFQRAIRISRRPRRWSSGYSEVLKLSWYFCRKHISFVQIVTVMRINSSLFQTPLSIKRPLFAKTKSVHVARFTGPRQTCFAASDVTLMYGVTLICFYPIRSQYHATVSNLYIICCKTGLNLGSVKHATQVFTFYTFCSNVAKQVARSCCPFYRSFIQEWKRFSKFVTRALNLFVFRVKMLFKVATEFAK